MSREKIDIFGGEGSDANNALYQAILDCADDECPDEPRTPDNYHMYKFLNEVPRASLVCHIVDKLRENGFDIVKKD